ncbi:MAG: hypothetical protein ABIM99_04405 [Candidatus Dojkabacteria bacterium]
MKYPDEKLILETVGEYSKNRRFLDLTGQDGAYSIIALENGAKTVTINEEREGKLESLSKDLPVNIMTEDFDSFLGLCEDTNEEYDVIVLHSDRFNEDIDLQRDHKEIIRRLNNRILADAGILIFIVRNNSFVLDSYLKPGSDKLTKKMLVDGEEKRFQCWAFYN